eukprot:1150605-Pelagomonas_calceolata.AAC.2
MMGMRVCAFGWQPQGPQRELIESSGVDGFLMGPIHPQDDDALGSVLCVRCSKGVLSAAGTHETVCFA